MNSGGHHPQHQQPLKSTLLLHQVRTVSEKPPGNIFRNVDQNIFQMVSQGRGRGEDKTSTDLTTTDGSDSVTSKDSGELQRGVYLAYY